MMASINYVPQRIACLQPSATVTLAKLGLLDRVIACTKWCRDLCPEVTAAGASVISDSWSAKASEILACRPDLVIASVPYRMEALAEILKSAVPFVALAPKSLADVYSDIALIARVAGAENQGTHVIAEMQREIEEIRLRARGSEGNRRPLVFCEEWGKPMIHSQRWVAELVEAAGGEFVGEPGGRTGVEAIIDADPEVIIAAWCGAGDRVPLEKLVAMRGWQNLRAVREGKVYCVNDEYLNTPAPTLVSGLKALASAIHPEIFGEEAPGLRRMLMLEHVGRR
jgi:iron complex transport system substrate-binding protein